MSYQSSQVAVLVEADFIVRYFDRGDFDDIKDKELMTMLGNLKRAIEQYRAATDAMVAATYPKAA